MVVEFAVGDGDGGGSLNDVDEAIGASGHGDMVDPYVVGAEDGDGVAIAPRTQSYVVDPVYDQSAGGRNNVVHPYIVDDHIMNKLEGDPCSIGYMDLHSPAINCLIAREYELFLELDDHATGEYDPQGLRLDDSMAEGPGPGVVHVVVRWIGDHVVSALLAPRGAVAEPTDTFG